MSKTGDISTGVEWRRQNQAVVMKQKTEEKRGRWMDQSRTEQGEYLIRRKEVSKTRQIS